MDSNEKIHPGMTEPWVLHFHSLQREGDSQAHSQLHRDRKISLSMYTTAYVFFLNSCSFSAQDQSYSEVLTYTLIFGFARHNA